MNILLKTFIISVLLLSVADYSFTNAIDKTVFKNHLIAKAGLGKTDNGKIFIEKVESIIEKYSNNIETLELLESRIENVKGKYKEQIGEDILLSNGIAYLYGRIKITLEQLEKNQITKKELPADPGQKGRETLLGIDSDNDGVRDDVQIAIPSLYEGESEDTIEKLLESFRLFQNIFIASESNNDLEIQKAILFWLEYYNCTGLFSMTDYSEVLMVNTEERTKVYSYSNILLSGMSFGFNKPESDFCKSIIDGSYVFDIKDYE